MPVGFPGFMPTKWIDCTPSDATDLTGCIAFRVGGAGDVAVRTINDPNTTMTFSACAGGEIIPGNFTRIMAASTATLIDVAY
jgi:hypothetical protein